MSSEKKSKLKLKQKEEDPSKNQQNELNEYLPRYENVNKIKIPKSRQGFLVIPPNSEGFGYRYDCFDNQLLDNKITQQEFVETVYTATKICSKTYGTKKDIENKDPMELEKKQISYTQIFMILGLILIMLVVYTNTNLDLLLTLFGASILILASIAQAIMIHKSQQRTPFLMNLETECYKRLKEFLDGENVKYNQKGLSWSIGHKFYWLELRVNGYQGFQ